MPCRLTVTEKYGISGRARLFEVIERVTQLNNGRRRQLAGRQFAGKSVSEDELNSHPELEADYIAATPRMALYVKYSTRIYDIYLKYISETTYMYTPSTRFSWT